MIAGRTEVGRILLLTKTDFTPPHDGGTLRVSAVVERLRAAGYEVDWVSIRTPDGTMRRSTPRAKRPWRQTIRVALAVVRVGSISVGRWCSVDAVAQIVELIRRRPYSVVLVEFSQLLIYRSLFDRTPVILDMHNVEHLLLANYAASTASSWRRLLARYEAARVRRLELRAPFLTAAITTVSTHDTKEIRRASPSIPIVTAPNGVSEDAFGVGRTPPLFPTVVFIGLLGWQPNIDAAQWLIRDVWPTVRHRCPSARLQLIGRRPAPSLFAYDGDDGISVHPDVPSTLPYLGAATVAVAPLLAAGGTRLKILEALATGTPVVATSLGALGLEHLAREGVMTIADHADHFADALVSFITHGSEPELVRAEVGAYRWSLALKPLVDLVGTTAVSHKRTAAEPQGLSGNGPG